MTNLNVNSATFSRPLSQEFLSLAPISSGISNSQDILTTQDTHNDHQKAFWEGLLSLFIKIPLIKHIVLFIWTKGLGALQPKKPAKTLYNSGINVPSWFNPSMQVQCILSWKEHLTKELTMIRENPELDLGTLQRLSQIKIPAAAYQNDDLMEELEQEIKESISVFIEKMQKAYAREPLQLHLGGYSYEPLSKRKPISTFFLRAFASYLQSKKIPLSQLHVHGPLDNPAGIVTLLEGLKACPSLTNLHLDLGARSAQKAFSVLDQTLRYTEALTTLVFKADASTSIPILTNEWERLAEAIKSHKHLKSLSFPGHSAPPPAFKKALAPLETSPLPGTSSEGFCIKIP